MCALRTERYVHSLTPMLELVHVLFGPSDIYIHWLPYWNWSKSSFDRAICIFTDTHTRIGPCHLRTERYIPSLTPILELVYVTFGPRYMYLHWLPYWNWSMSSSDSAICTFTDTHTWIGPCPLQTERFVHSLTPVLELVHVLFGPSDMYLHWHPYWNWSKSSSDWAICTFTDTHTWIGPCPLRTERFVHSLTPVLELVQVIFGPSDMYLHLHPYWNRSKSSSDWAIYTFTDTHNGIGPSHLRTARYVPSLTPILKLVYVTFGPSDTYLHWHPYWNWSKSSSDRAICIFTDTHTGIGPSHLRTERYVHSLTPILELVHVIFGPIDMYLHWHPYLNWPMSQIIRYTIKLSLGSHTSHSLQTTDTCINLLT